MSERICLLLVSSSPTFSDLGQFKHGFQSKFILHKVILHISIVSQISKTLNSPFSCLGINLRITKPSIKTKKRNIYFEVMLFTVKRRIKMDSKVILHTGLCVDLQILTFCTAWPVFLWSLQQIALNCNHHRRLTPIYRVPKQDIKKTSSILFTLFSLTNPNCVLIF